MIWWREPTAGDLLDLCRDMRDTDRREIFCLRAHEDREKLAAEIYAGLPRAVVALAIGLDTNPAAIAFLAIWPVDESGFLGSAHLFGTPRFAAVARPLVRLVRTRLIPELIGAGLRRVECRVWEQHASARRFLKACGAIEESAPMPDLGKNGEAFILCAWRRSDYVPVDTEATGAAGH